MYMLIRLYHSPYRYNYAIVYFNDIFSNIEGGWEKYYIDGKRIQVYTRGMRMAEDQGLSPRRDVEVGIFPWLTLGFSFNQYFIKTL